MESGLAIESQPVPGVADAARIALSGPLDAKSVMAFKTAVHGLQSTGVKRFILDLTDVKYINSTGLSYLINLAESLGPGQTAVTLVGMQPKVKIVFDTMGVADFFKSAASVDAAIKTLGKPPAAAKPAAAPKKPAAPAPRKPAPPPPAPAVKRDHSSTKTGRVRPPTAHEPPPKRGFFSRLFRKLFGRK